MMQSFIAAASLGASYVEVCHSREAIVLEPANDIAVVW